MVICFVGLGRYHVSTVGDDFGASILFVLEYLPDMSVADSGVVFVPTKRRTTFHFFTLSVCGCNSANG